VLPYYKRMETSHGGEAGWRGTDGPLNVTRGSLQNPLYQAFIEAGREAGYPVTDDYNGRAQEGFGVMEMTVWKGRRWSAANAYLRPALKRGNLRLIAGVNAERIVFEGSRATGVAIRRGNRTQVVTARREVIVAASSINSPKLLMLSGIGAANDLKAHGIDVIADRPGVGANLQDHLEVYVQYGSRQPITLNSQLGLFSKAWIGANWLFLKRGLGVSNQFESCAFIRSAAGVDYPDIQYHFLPAAVRYDGKAAVDRHGFQVHVGPMRSRSRGSVTLRSGKPSEPPKIVFNYMSEQQDWEEFRASIRLTREIMAQAAMEPFVDDEIKPGAQATGDEAIDAFIREHVESAYHPCGTCRMGSADDAGAVVDPRCRVIGVQNLRVVDSSIFPQITNGNLNGPSIMVGEKAADLILGKDPLPASNQEPWINPDWRTSQR
jgi:choline dehydrogenase